jgi:predicted SPOUT superfamily RNA methylase MTH1
LLMVQSVPNTVTSSYMARIVSTFDISIICILKTDSNVSVDAKSVTEASQVLIRI